LESIDLSIFSDSKKLKEIHMESNEIKTLSNTNNIELNALIELNLSTNLIKTIDPIFFKSFPKLLNLNLFSNRIETLDETMLASLKNLNKFKTNQFKFKSD